MTNGKGAMPADDRVHDIAVRLRLDLGERSLGRRDAAGAHDGELLLHALVDLRQHFGRKPEQRLARQAAGFAAPPRPQRVRTREGRVADDDAVHPEIAAHRDDVVEIVVGRIRCDLDHQRHRLGGDRILNALEEVRELLALAQLVVARLEQLAQRCLLLAQERFAQPRHQFDAGRQQLAAQVRQALQNIVAVLAEAGAGPEHLVRLTWYVTDRNEYLNELPAVGAAYRDVIGRNFPAMAVVAVTALMEAQAKVEIEATAVLPDEGT